MLPAVLSDDTEYFNNNKVVLELIFVNTYDNIISIWDV